MATKESLKAGYFCFWIESEGQTTKHYVWISGTNGRVQRDEIQVMFADWIRRRGANNYSSGWRKQSRLPKDVARRLMVKAEQDVEVAKEQLALLKKMV